MTMQPNVTTRTTTAALACLLLLAAGPAWAQSNPSSNTPATRDAGTLSHDCTEVTVDYTDDATLTREERIARMDRAFQRSLSRFEECQSERAGTGGGAGGGGGSGSGNAGSGTAGSGTAGSGAAGSESNGAETSTAASDISGPDAPVDAPSSAGSSTAASDVTGDEPTVTAATTPGTATTSTSKTSTSKPGGKWTPPDDMESTQTTEDGPTGDEPKREAARTQGGGKLPEDIPPADNDSALEAQIRQAAIEETDPELKKRLWDEYRRYKGLPVPN